MHGEAVTKEARNLSKLLDLFAKRAQDHAKLPGVDLDDDDLSWVMAYLGWCIDAFADPKDPASYDVQNVSQDLDILIHAARRIRQRIALIKRDLPQVSLIKSSKATLTKPEVIPTVKIEDILISEV